MKRVLLVLIGLVVGLQSAFCEPENGVPAKKEILFVTSYSIDTQYSNEFIENLMEEYRDKGGSYQVVIEAMNAYSLDSSPLWVPTLEGILSRHPDVSMVILYGQEAWASYFSLSQEKYRKLPVICVGGQRFSAPLTDPSVPAVYSSASPTAMDMLEIQKPFNVKGMYYYEYDVEADMELLRDCFPQVGQLAIISDNSYSGNSNRSGLLNFLEQHYPQLPLLFIDGRELDMDAAATQVQQLPANTAIFFCMWKYDKNGAIKTNYDHHMFHLITDEKRIPVISLTGSGFGSWALGGSHPVYTWGEVRRKPVDIMLECLDRGEDPNRSLYRIANRLRVDQAVLNRFNILQSVLPENAVVINRQDLTFSQIWDSFKWSFMTGLLVLVLLIICFVISVLYIIHMRKMKTRLAQAMEHAEKANQMKGEFIQNISREIRTPLNAIQGFSQLILDDTMELDHETKQAMFIDITNSVKTITDQMDNIVLLSQIDSNPEKPVATDVSLIDVFDLARANVFSYMPRRVAVELKLPHEIIFHTNKEDLVCILTQLISNAVKFTKRGEVIVNAMKDLDGSRLTVAVTDNGPGVPQPEAENIFGRFYKLDSFVPGTGLGLTIARMLARRQGGDVYLDTTYMKGARFILTLPQTKDGTAPLFRQKD